ncbi:hypothetical protein [Bacillus toyonensis]|uniref:hypothetical protein n=1 Tax=Bacillus toyonensis TaxID=155322 RepID=UPI001C0AA2D5|nr:hypothetical protein [Bacillus toyonensis]MBU4643043.1 hypothetical protein [Bacillus toyonensis]
MRARRYEYLVTYHWKGNGVSGFLHKTLIFGRKVNQRLLEEAEDFIKEEKKFKNVCIHNYQLLREMRS